MITIIVLLILAAVTITTLTGENGLLERARLSRIYTRKAEAEDKLRMEISQIQIDKNGEITLEEVLNEFKKDEKTTIEVTEVLTQEIGTINCEIPVGTIKEITVILEKYEEFSFTIDKTCEITKICGIEKEMWNGETLEDLGTAKARIVIEAMPDSQTENYVGKQDVDLKLTSTKKWENWTSKYAWNGSKTEEPHEEYWKTLTLNEGSKKTEKIATITNTEDVDGSYYLWVEIVMNGKTTTKSFGPYNIEAVPSSENIICVMNNTIENGTKGIVEVGSNKVFTGWRCTYRVNSGTETEVTIGQTATIQVVKNDVIVVKLSKAGYTDVEKTLTADELKIGYTLSYDANGGTSAPASVTQYDNQTFTITNSEPTQSGYIFSGWNSKADGTGTNYTSGGSISITQNTILYAKWTRVYTITYNGNGATSGTMAPTQIEEGKQKSLSTNTFVKTNYEFIGWTTNSDGTGNSYADGQTITGAENIILYANWKKTLPIASELKNWMDAGNVTLELKDILQSDTLCNQIVQSSEAIEYILSDKECLQYINEVENIRDKFLENEKFFNTIVNNIDMNANSINLITTMTTNDTEKVIYPHLYSNSEAPYMAFDGNNNTFYTYSSGTKVTNAYIGYKFDNSKIIYKFSYVPRWYKASTTDYIRFIVKGSNDGNNWSNLSNEITINSSQNGSYIGEKVEIPINNLISCRYKKIQFTKTSRDYMHLSGTYCFSPAEIQFYGIE